MPPLIPTDPTVSTHAPTRGATATSTLNFQTCLFQPTRPRGARQTGQCGRRPPPSFNPRAHEGRDGTHDDVSGHQHVSTHAPTRGATEAKYAEHVEMMFQPTRPRGARRRSGVADGLHHVSTHAPTRGATTVNSPDTDGWEFQPTRPRGARPDLRLRGIEHRWFQPTRPRGARPPGA